MCSDIRNTLFNLAIFVKLLKQLCWNFTKSSLLTFMPCFYYYLLYFLFVHSYGEFLYINKIKTIETMSAVWNNFIYIKYVEKHHLDLENLTCPVCRWVWSILCSPNLNFYLQWTNRFCKSYVKVVEIESMSFSWHKFLFVYNSTSLGIVTLVMTCFNHYLTKIDLKSYV
jgi:hypothetical protein